MALTAPPAEAAMDSVTRIKAHAVTETIANDSAEESNQSGDGQRKNPLLYERARGNDRQSARHWYSHCAEQDNHA